jgi:hypothetical protein
MQSRKFYLGRWRASHPALRPPQPHRYTTHWHFWPLILPPSPVEAPALPAASESTVCLHQRCAKHGTAITCTDHHGVNRKQTLLATNGYFHSFITNSFVRTAVNALNSIILKQEVNKLEIVQPTSCIIAAPSVSPDGSILWSCQGLRLLSPSCVAADRVDDEGGECVAVIALRALATSHRFPSTT